MFDRGIPLLGIRGLQIVIQHSSRTGQGERAPTCRCCIGQHGVFIGSDREWLGEKVRRIPGEDRIVGRILNGVERRVTEVAIVVDAVSAAQDGPAIAEEIVGKTGARTEVPVTWSIELVCPAEPRVTNFLIDGLARCERWHRTNGVQIQVGI